ncbi:13251_t:CDS:2 [Acaulospora colombiana]|uniref:13251_t:CDS:1 n=1 Tax=Acaulospora colombiana TaxID=27376 RepID=A0ACA9LL33_9GLOM|nr:13251_t:CDS:2 [Acaulospora colombiana]
MESVLSFLCVCRNRRKEEPEIHENRIANLGSIASHGIYIEPWEQETSHQVNNNRFNEQHFETVNMFRDCEEEKSSRFWCNTCARKYFSKGFSDWTSGSAEIDTIIRESQLNSRNVSQVIEWIPYKKLKGLKPIGEGGFSVVYSTIWSDGPLDYWDEKVEELSRRKNYRVALKRLKITSDSRQMLNEGLGDQRLLDCPRLRD